MAQSVFFMKKLWFIPPVKAESPYLCKQFVNT